MPGTWHPDRCQPLLLPAVGGDAEEAALQRAVLIGQLDELRRTAAADGLGYLGALAGEKDASPVLILLAIAATPIRPLTMAAGISQALVPFPEAGLPGSAVYVAPGLPLGLTYTPICPQCRP